MKLTGVRCPLCKQVIYSRARHDFRWCSCKATFVDGGLDYLRYGGKTGLDQERVSLEVEATPGELYDDWRFGADRYGTVPTTDQLPRGETDITAVYETAVPGATPGEATRSDSGSSLK